MKLFSPDSRFMRAMGTLGDLMLLNLVFLLCCVPLVTGGAAIAALDTAVFRLAREEGGGVLPLFFQSFRQNLRRATPLWLLLLLAGAVAMLDLWLSSSFGGGLRLLLVPSILLFLLTLFAAGYAFPLLSQFDNTVGGTLKNALFLSLGYLPRTLAITALNLLPFVLLFAKFTLFLTAGFLWVFLYFSAAAYLNVKLLDKVFARYREEKKEDAV